MNVINARQTILAHFITYLFQSSAIVGICFEVRFKPKHAWKYVIFIEQS